MPVLTNIFGSPFEFGTPASTTVYVPPVVVQPSGPMSQAFTITNWGSANSPSVYKRGVWFKKGDVPAGQIPALSQGTAQFYGKSFWNDGSLKHARMWLRDASPLAAGTSRSYTITAAAGSLAGSTKAIGNAGLGSALTEHDFKVLFTNVKDSAGATYGGGALTASLATHATVGTRWEMLSTGAVADVWQGWGMAGSDAHLKVNWYITRLKNSDGSTLAWRIGAAPALDWWSVAGKSDLTYDATLADGPTTILSFSGVQHYYHSQWLFCINDGSFNAGQIPWVGAATPTLDYTFDKTYMILAGHMAAPLRRDKMPPARTMSPYVPCNVIQVDGHRTYTDAGGGYSGRGPVPRFDSDAFMGQTPQFNTISRLNALTGLSIVFHYKSNRQRTRSGEAADTANTNIVLLMAPKPSSASNFTAQGLPIAVDAYTGGATDGYVVPSKLSSNPWNTTADSTHAVSYSYYQYLVSGDEHFLDAQLDITLNLAHQQIITYQQNRPSLAAGFNSACPTDQYSGLLGMWAEGVNIRYFGWTALIQGHGFGLVPADHQYKFASQALMSHQGDYLELSLTYMPPSFTDAGVITNNTTPHMSPWMLNFGAIGSYFHYALNEDNRWLRSGNWIANWVITLALAGRWYQWDNFRNLTRASTAAWNATTNPNLSPVDMPFFGVTFDLGADAYFTQTAVANWNDVGPDPAPLRNGDKVFFTMQGEGGNADGTVIPGVAEGTTGYVINLTNGDKFAGQNHPPPSPAPRFQVSATPGGFPMTFGGQIIAQVNMPTRVQSVGDSAYAVSSQPIDYLHFPYYYDMGNYMPISYTVLNMARHAGNAKVTTALRDAAIAFTAPTVANIADQNYYSAFDTVAIV